MTAPPTELTPLKTSSTATPERRTSSITRVATIAGGVFAVAGIVSLYGARANAPGLRGVHLGDKPNHAAIAMDAEVGPLSPQVRNAARIGLSQSSLPTPACFAECVLEGLDIEPDSSYCYGLESDEVKECYDSCDAVEKGKYDVFINDLCPDGTGFEVDPVTHAGEFDSDVPVGDDEDVTSDDEISPTKMIDEAEKYADATLGEFQAGPRHIAEDAELSLTTWECDFQACGAQHPDVNVGQYVDDSCGDLGGVGCEGALGDQTRCRACYLVEADKMDFAGNLGYPRCPMCLCKEFDLPRNSASCALAFTSTSSSRLSPCAAASEAIRPPRTVEACNSPNSSCTTTTETRFPSTSGHRRTRAGTAPSTATRARPRTTKVPVPPSTAPWKKSFSTRISRATDCGLPSSSPFRASR